MTRTLLLFVLPHPLGFSASSLGCTPYPFLLPSPFGFLARVVEPVSAFAARSHALVVPALALVFDAQPHVRVVEPPHAFGRVELAQPRRLLPSNSSSSRVEAFSQLGGDWIVIVPVGVVGGYPTSMSFDDQFLRRVGRYAQDEMRVEVLRPPFFEDWA